MVLGPVYLLLLPLFQLLPAKLMQKVICNELLPISVQKSAIDKCLSAEELPDTIRVALLSTELN